MPTGLLIFCLDYAKKDTEPLPGVFKSVRNHFSDLAGTDLPTLLNEFYDFRNTYIAHEKKELTDVDTTRNGLRLWCGTVQGLYAALS